MGVFGPQGKSILTSAESADIAVAGEVTVYSKAISLRYGAYFSVSLLVTAGTTKNLKIEFEQSFQLPATEGSADTYWAVPENMDDIIDGLNDGTIRHINISPLPLRYGRLKITGLTGNSSDVVLKAWISEQQEM